MGKDFYSALNTDQNGTGLKVKVVPYFIIDVYDLSQILSFHVKENMSHKHYDLDFGRREPPEEPGKSVRSLLSETYDEDLSSELPNH